MIEQILKHLGTDDDPELWRVVIEIILSDLESTPGVRVEIGRCSHWLRPHQARWTVGGGFAWPTGYGGSGYSISGLPLFDWSVLVAWTGDHWESAKAKTKKGQAMTTSLRITIPSRTTRHPQAAIHTLWKSGRKTELRFYGFRKKDGVWHCTAESVLPSNWQ